MPTAEDEHVRKELVAADGLHAFTPSPMETGDIKGPPHDQGDLRRRWPVVPVETPHHRGSQHRRTEGAMRPLPEKRCQRTSRSKHSTRKHHQHRRRLTPLLHQEGCQIYLLNNRISTCTKEERDSTTTIPATMATTNRWIQQPPTQGW
jgi:hypothetical protein